MADYDFTSSLSPLDFELLSKDLLEAELGIRLENFREGKDRGIDLRYAPARWNVLNGRVVQNNADSPRIIVQCKRYADFSSLKSVLKNSELEKIKKLNPGRYILTTAVPLSPQQADELKETLHPYVKTTDDIFGRDRLNALLAKHAEVERRHIKLWVGSSGVLDSIVNARTHIVSREEVERTIRTAKIYVRNQSFDEALDKLKQHRVCIIAGLPGIGKTTLARMLLLYFFNNGFDIVKIESDISEARDVGFSTKPRFYYYDDFLGQTAHADKLNKNEDQKLVDFIESVNASKDAVFVLTTREYILTQAKLYYEKLSRTRFDHRMCIIDMSKYPRRIRAQILYNHLYFSNLPREYIDAVVSKRGYVEIVDHKNYNPRLIEYLTDRDWLGKTTPQEYMGVFTRNLDNPVEIWGHAFENQLSAGARHLLIALTGMRLRCREDQLKETFDILHQSQCAKLGITQRSDDFRRSLREVDGTFVATKNLSGTVVVQFGNPSIRDYMVNRILGGEMLDEAINAFTFFEQPSWMVDMLLEKESKISLVALETKKRAILDKMKELFESPACTFYVVESQGRESAYSHQISIAERLAKVTLLARLLKEEPDTVWINEQMGTMADDLTENRLRAHECAPYIGTFKRMEYLDSKEGQRLVAIVKSILFENPSDTEDFEAVGKVVDDLPEILQPEEIESIRSEYGAFIDKHSSDYEATSPEDMRDESYRIGKIGRLLDVDTTDAIEVMKERAKELEKDIEAERDWEADDDGRVSTAASEYFSDSDLDAMYGSLK